MIGLFLSCGLAAAGSDWVDERSGGEAKSEPGTNFAGAETDANSKRARELIDSELPLDDLPEGIVENGAAASVSGRGKMLSGQVAHHQISLPAVDNQFRAGATFDESKLAEGAGDSWYWIPRWLAGKWERREEKILYRFDYLTHQETYNPGSINLLEHAEFGVQTDRNGGIWHCRLADIGMADRGSYMTIAIVKEQQPLVVSPATVILRDRFIQMDVNKETRAIMRVFQSESITRHWQVEPNLIKTAVSVKYFDENGQPTSEQRNLSFDRRVESFSALGKYHGKDLQSSFRRFLAAHDMPDLIPNAHKHIRNDDDKQSAVKRENGK